MASREAFEEIGSSERENMKEDGQAEFAKSSVCPFYSIVRQCSGLRALHINVIAYNIVPTFAQMPD